MKNNFIDCLGEVYLFKNGTIARVVEINYGRKGKYNPGHIKLRCVRRCSGVYGKNDGHSYTYQRWCELIHLQKAKRVGTEEVLTALYCYRRNKKNETT